MIRMLLLFLFLSFSKRIFWSRFLLSFLSNILLLPTTIRTCRPSKILIIPEFKMNKSIKTKLLLIDGEDRIRKIIQISLKNENFEIIEADDGAMGIRMFLSLKPDIVITDIGLSDMDGKEVIKTLCELGNVPIIACSARFDDAEIIATLNCGAYDYVEKPFNPEVLLARINANLRRSAVNQQNAVGEFLINGPVKMNLLKHEVEIDGKIIFFPPKQYNLLKFLMLNKGKVLTHKEILKEIWGCAYLQENQYLRVHIGNIRMKLNSSINSNLDMIQTTSGIGYYMENIAG